MSNIAQRAGVFVKESRYSTSKRDDILQQRHYKEFSDLNVSFSAWLQILSQDNSSLEEWVEVRTET